MIKVWLFKNLVPGHDNKTNAFTGYKNIRAPKTYYDLSVISDADMIKYAKGAMRNGKLNDKKSMINGSTKINGQIVEFAAHFNSIEFRTVYPNF